VNPEERLARGPVTLPPQLAPHAETTAADEAFAALFAAVSTNVSAGRARFLFVRSDPNTPRERVATPW
jgi:hypothetical protein